MREMGKAMMGTGEASGERRAILAAEAAIANPLLDETSMHGARGLLISITGGRDLTLFEVDEAATRIREEVDPDANIILGATFEESLEGVIRVSVVATGIESEVQEQAPSNEQRMAELNQRMKAAAQAAVQAPAPRAPHVETRAQAPAQPLRQAAPSYAAAQPTARDPGVTIAPMPPQPAVSYAEAELDHEFDLVPQPADVVEPAQPQHFIPPAAEAPASTRMPRVEDFPMVAQREIQAQRGEEPHAEEDRGPMSLLRRLAHVGLGRREEEAAAAPQPPQARTAPAQMPRAPQPQGQPRPAQAPQPVPQAAVRPQAPRPAAPAPAEAYRPRQAELDPHGRVAPREARHEDDQLEIPAFLRRQAN
jgi:cell division protein FtsZ